MACWSAWTYDGVFSEAHQYEATPQVRPPSSERKRSTPAAQTRLGSFGSTLMTLQCHPMLLRFSVVVEAQPCVVAEKTLVKRSGPYAAGVSLVRTCAVHVPSAPPSFERKTASSP